MKRNQIEDKIRERILQMEEEVDVSKIMAGIPVVSQKGRNAFAFWWLGATAGVIMVAGLSYYLTASSTGITNDDVILEKKEMPSLLSGNQQTSNQETSTSFIIDEPLKGLRKTLDENESGPVVIQNNSKVLKALKENQTFKSESTSKKKNLTPVSSQTQEKQNNFTINEPVSVIAVTSNVTSNNLIENGESTDIVGNTASADLSSSIKSLFETKVIDQLKLNELDASLFVTTSKFAPVLPKRVDCPTFGANPWGFEIGSVIGISNPSKSLAPKNNNIPAYPSRAINEKSLEGLDLELFLSAKRARWPVFIKSGVNYSRWAERMNIDESYTEIDTVQGIISTTVSQSGDTITYIYGDIYVESDYEIRKSIHYFLHRLDIPLSVVYEGYIAQNQSLQAELGTRINFSTLASGRIYNNDLEFSKASLPGFFRRFSGLSYFTKMHYRYYLSEKQFLGASAYFQYLPADFSTTQNQIEQRYLNYGIGVYYGMRF